GAEDLVFVAVHAGPHVVQQRRAEEETIPLCGGIVAAVDDDGGAFAFGVGHIGGDAVAVLAGDQGAHFHAVFGAASDFDFDHAFADGGNEGIGRRADGDDDGDGHAALARGAVGGGDGRVGGHINVGVREDQHVVL